MIAGGLLTSTLLEDILKQNKTFVPHVYNELLNFSYSRPIKKTMPDTHTYRPQTAQIPADSLRAGSCDPCDPRRFPRDPRRHVPPAHPILNSSFLILNCTYTFSAKEKDPETGLSYFGSRYYSSDLSIWLSVDPMSDKYPSLSNYAYCRNNPIRLIDPNGMFDSEARATKFREKAVKKYGEDRVSDVYNNTYGEGKANYSFSIYGEGKNKYSQDGGTNEYGGPIITCDKSDIVVSSGKDFRSYNKSHRSKYGIRIEASISLGAQVGDYIDVKRHKLGFDVNISSVDIARLSISKEGNQPVDFDSHIISPDATQHNIGFSVGPISYEHNRNYYFNDLVSEKQTVSVFGYNLHSSDPSEIASAKFGMRLGIGFDIKINLTKK